MPSPASNRYVAVDMLRGLAMMWMTLFHFCFDLQYFGYLQADFYRDPFWTQQRSAIVSLFLLCAGLGQAIALQQGLSLQRFWRRWWQIAASALLVSAGSYAVFPGSFIYFGVLHGVALMLIVTRLAAPRAGRLLWPLGALALALPGLAAQAHVNWPSLDFLNASSWNWLGLISRKPVTEDYVPLFPWLGMMFWGLALGSWLTGRHAQALEQAARHLTKRAPWRGLAWLGRWSLSYYMLHQPVLLGLLALWGLLH